MGNGIKIYRTGGVIPFNEIAFLETIKLKAGGSAVFSTVIESGKLYVISGGYYSGPYGDAESAGFFHGLVYNRKILFISNTNPNGGGFVHSAEITSDGKIQLTSADSSAKYWELYEVI